MAPDQELVDLLDEVWASMSRLGGELDEADRGRPTEVPGWTVQDNLVHITGIETFARLACGRTDPAAALAAGDVVVSGDEALGRRVVEHLNVLF